MDTKSFKTVTGQVLAPLIGLPREVQLPVENDRLRTNVMTVLDSIIHFEIKKQTAKTESEKKQMPAGVATPLPYGTTADDSERRRTSVAPFRGPGHVEQEQDHMRSIAQDIRELKDSFVASNMKAMPELLKRLADELGNINATNKELVAHLKQQAPAQSHSGTWLGIGTRAQYDGGPVPFFPGPCNTAQPKTDTSTVAPVAGASTFRSVPHTSKVKPDVAFAPPSHRSAKDEEIGALQSVLQDRDREIRNWETLFYGEDTQQLMEVAEHKDEEIFKKDMNQDEEIAALKAELQDKELEIRDWNELLLSESTQQLQKNIEDKNEEISKKETFRDLGMVGRTVDIAGVNALVSIKDAEIKRLQNELKTRARPTTCSLFGYPNPGTGVFSSPGGGFSGAAGRPSGGQPASGSLSTSMGESSSAVHAASVSGLFGNAVHQPAPQHSQGSLFGVPGSLFGQLPSHPPASGFSGFGNAAHQSDPQPGQGPLFHGTGNSVPRGVFDGPVPNPSPSGFSSSTAAQQVPQQASGMLFGSPTTKPSAFSAQPALDRDVAPATARSGSQAMPGIFPGGGEHKTPKKKKFSIFDPVVGPWNPMLYGSWTRDAILARSGASHASREQQPVGESSTCGGSIFGEGTTAQCTHPVNSSEPGQSRQARVEDDAGDEEEL
jgi:hypothetical protein